MVMAPVGNTFSSIVIFLVLLHSLWHVAVRGEHQLNLEGIFARQTVCSESKVLGDRSVKIVHAYGSCSPTCKKPPTIMEMLARDSLRLAHLHRRVRPQAVDAANNSNGGDTRLGQSASTTIVPVGDTLTMGSSGYMVPIYVGTPGRMMHVILDTGSDLCWIQCEPCIHCYSQEQPIFNPTASSSFRYEQCADPVYNHHPVVRSSSDDNDNNHNRCHYRIEYEDDSHSSGFLVRDKVALVGTAWQGKFLFGCGNNNGGDFIGTAGVVGLGHTDLSLNKQMSHMGNIFSYCLPPTYRDSGHLTLGDGPYPPAVYTPIVPEPDQPDHFFIHLLAMSVNSQLLPVPEGLFVGAKTIIDTGSMVTFIPKLAYNALRTVIRNSMRQYRRVPLVTHLDTCYDLGNATMVNSPTVTLHFTGAEVHLGFAQTFINDPEREHIYCLAFVANRLRDELSVVGAIQQRGLEVIYDLGRNKIGFSTIITNCH